MILIYISQVPNTITKRLIKLLQLNNYVILLRINYAERSADKNLINIWRLNLNFHKTKREK